MFSTANGLTTADQEISMNVPELNETVTATILEDTPNVLSLGYRCAALGYDFHWPPWAKNPTFTHPEGWQIPCRTQGYIPYIHSAVGADRNNDRAAGAENVKDIREDENGLGSGVPDSASLPKKAIKAY